MTINYKYTLCYTTKCDNVRRYHECKSYEHALACAKEWKRLNNLFKNITILKELVKN